MQYIFISLFFQVFPFYADPSSLAGFRYTSSISFLLQSILFFCTWSSSWFCVSFGFMCKWWSNWRLLELGAFTIGLQVWRCSHACVQSWDGTCFSAPSDYIRNWPESIALAFWILLSACILSRRKCHILSCQKGAFLSAYHGGVPLSTMNWILASPCSWKFQTWVAFVFHFFSTVVGGTSVLC